MLHLHKSAKYMILLVEGLILLAGILFSCRPLETKQYEMQDFIHIEREDQESGIVDVVPVSGIGRGVYRVSVNYSSDSLGNQLKATTYNNHVSYHSVRMDEFVLNPDLTKKSQTLWVSQELPTGGLGIWYGGEGELNVQSVKIEELAMGRIYDCLCLLLALVILYLVIRLIIAVKTGVIAEEKVYVVGLLSLIVVFVSVPLFLDYLPEGDDLRFHLLRIRGIADGLRAGQFPVRIHPTQFYGHGYANSIFYGELFLYLPALLHLGGVPLMVTYQWYLFLLNVATVLIFFGISKKIFGNVRLSILGTFLFAAAPYRLINLYTRAALGEATAMTFLPLIIAGLYLLYHHEPSHPEYKSYKWYLVLGYTGILESHILTTQMAAFLCIVFCLVAFRKTFQGKRFLQLVEFGVITLILNAWFIVPLLDYFLEGGFTITELGSVQTSVIQGNGIYPAQLFLLFLNGAGLSLGHQIPDYASYGMTQAQGISVGLAYIVSLVYFLYLAIGRNSQVHTEENYSAAKTLAMMGIFLLWMSTLTFPWDVLCRLCGSVIYNIQFPWRFLSPATAVLSVLTLFLLQMSKMNTTNNLYRHMVMLLIVLHMVNSGYLLYSYLDESEAVYTYDGSVFENKGSGALSEYLLVYVDTDEIHAMEYPTVSNCAVTGYVKSGTNIRFKVSDVKKGENGSGAYVTLPLFAYSGYHVTNDAGETIGYMADGNGRILLEILPGYEGEISVSFGGKWFWRVAEGITLLGIVFFIYSIVKFHKKKSDISL